MSALGNIIWFIFGGWWNFLLYGFLGLLFSITIIGIPIGKALFQYAKLMVFPFGKVIIKETELKGKENVAGIRRVGGVIANLLWLPVGIALFIGNILLAVGTALTIIGIPVAIVLVRSATFLIWPVGAKVITKEQAEILRMEKSMMKVAGTAMAVNQMMSQQTVQAQPGYSVHSAGQIPQYAGNPESFGSQTADIPGSAAQSGAASGTGYTLESIVEKSERAVNGLREKVLQNDTMANLMPYLDYAALGLLALNVIGGLFFGAMRWGIVAFVLGLLLLAVTGLEIIKGNRLMVLILLGVMIVPRLLRLIGVGGMVQRVVYSGGTFFMLALSFIFTLFLIAVLVWYIIVFVRGKEPVVVFTTNSNAQQPSAGGSSVNSSAARGTGTMKAAAGAGSSAADAGIAAGMQTNAVSIRFCSQCGTEYSVGARFCPKCGARIPE
ncbi:zinc-ribbon domain-containing protein [Acetatifactor muris]|uniref:Inner membrane protein YccF n=1 Tax=Acetatifactor muris TaxID=879566 RepID=A0A2K4ZBX2_9FIRM|nr:YccF domain-containing protein [Acetatifactor muris]MCR2046480.1 zinc-ribbon domain-containing protein [Acetatifactor muris]SOY27952.1 Inner membrane protein YccF [Acetatifactor muris]